MDKQIINIKKTEEKELSNAVYVGLYVLTKMHKPTDDFQNMFEPDMFLKSNPKAFPHVMHYLFTILDPHEFKKRFYWPLYNDKNAENIFRSTCVQYLNYLNEKHKLGMEEVRSFIVVMPGGIKFMKVLHELILLVGMEELRKRDKLNYLTRDHDVSIFSFQTIQQMSKEKEIIDDVANRYKKKFNQTFLHFQQKTIGINNKIEKIMINSNLSYESISDGLFYKCCTEKRKDMEKNIQSFLERINDFFNEFEKIIVSVDEKCAENQEAMIKYNKDRLIETIETILAHNPELSSCYHHHKLYEGNKINSNTILGLTNKILPFLKSQIVDFKPRGFEIVSYESKELEKFSINVGKVKKEFDRLQIAIQKEKDVKPNLAMNSSVLELKAKRSVLPLKYVSTPPIPYKVSESTLGRISKPRLALMDNLDKKANLYSLSSKVLSTAIKIPITVKRAKSTNLSFMSSTQTRLDVNNALTALKTIKKKNKSQNLSKHIGLSSLAERWKQNELDMSDNINGNSSMVFMSTPEENEMKNKNHLINKSSTLLSVTSATSFQHEYSSPISEDSKRRIFKQKIIETTTTVSPDSIVFSRKTKKNSIVNIKCPLNINTIHTSPTGRLDGLSKIEKGNPTFFITSFQFCDKTLQEFEGKSPPLTKNLAQIQDDDKENQRDITFNSITDENESIFNVSDGVLKDVPL